MLRVDSVLTVAVYPSRLIAVMLTVIMLSVVAPKILQNYHFYHLHFLVEEATRSFKTTRPVTGCHELFLNVIFPNVIIPNLPEHNIPENLGIFWD